jgi:hypothetical protein
MLGMALDHTSFIVLCLAPPLPKGKENILMNVIGVSVSVSVTRSFIVLLLPGYDFEAF